MDVSSRLGALKTGNVAIIGMVVGIFILTISFLVQFKILDAGTSSQLAYDATMKNNLASVLLGAILFGISVGVYFYFETIRDKYLGLFILSMVSFALANFALYFSMFQVQLTKV
jgi:hypothetical protein